MPSDIVIAGLDIGSSKVCAAVGELDAAGQLVIRGVGTSPSSGLRRGIVINIESTSKAVTDAIQAAELVSGRVVSGVYAGIGGTHIEGTNSRGVVAVAGKEKEITQTDIDRVIEAARALPTPMDRDVIHIIPQEYIVDGEGGVRDPRDMIGVRLEAEIHIITGAVTPVQNLATCINRAGFRGEEVVLSSLAAAKAVLSKEEKDLGSLLIDLGGGTTDILVYRDGSPYYTNVLPLGGEQVTGDISIVLETPVESAEKIKRQHGACYAGLVDAAEDLVIPSLGGRPPLKLLRRNLCAIIQPRMTEIFSMVHSRIDAQGFAGKLSGGVILTGGGALLPGAVELAQEIFGCAARVGSPSQLSSLLPELGAPDYACAVGLAMYGAECLAPAAEEGAGGTSGGFFRSLVQWIRDII